MVVVGVDDELNPVAQCEFGEDPGDVGFDRGLRQYLGVGDLGVGQSAGGAHQDLPFTGREGLVFGAGITCTSAVPLSS